MYVKAATLTENYKSAHELWRKRNLDLKTDIKEKLLLNKKIYNLRK
jgi:hypothetical protein